MVKKKRLKQMETFIASEPSSLQQIVEDVGGKTWKANLETNPDKASEARYLRSKLGEYLSESELHARAGITRTELARWRRRGLLLAEKLNGIWYYALESVRAALKSERR